MKKIILVFTMLLCLFWCDERHRSICEEILSEHYEKIEIKQISFDHMIDNTNTYRCSFIYDYKKRGMLEIRYEENIENVIEYEISTVYTKQSYKVK